MLGEAPIEQKEGDGERRVRVAEGFWPWFFPSQSCTKLHSAHSAMVRGHWLSKHSSLIHLRHRICKTSAAHRRPDPAHGVPLSPGHRAVVLTELSRRSPMSCCPRWSSTSPRASPPWMPVWPRPPGQVFRGWSEVTRETSKGRLGIRPLFC